MSPSSNCYYYFFLLLMDVQSDVGAVVEMLAGNKRNSLADFLFGIIASPLASGQPCAGARYIRVSEGHRLPLMKL